MARKSLSHIPLSSIAAFWSGVWGCDAPVETCWGCLQLLPLTRAHVVADRSGGTRDLSNLVLLCRTCNSFLDDAQERHGTAIAIQWLQNNVTTRSPQLPPQALAIFMPLVWSQNDLTPVESMGLALNAYHLYCRTRR